MSKYLPFCLQILFLKSHQTWDWMVSRYAPFWRLDKPHRFLWFNIIKVNSFLLGRHYYEKNRKQRVCFEARWPIYIGNVKGEGLGYSYSI